MSDRDHILPNEADAVEFMTALARDLPDDERLIFCGFAGDPGNRTTANWQPRSWRPGDGLPISPARTNGYVCVSSMRRAADRTWRRTRDCFAAGRALMVDDVGTKVPFLAFDQVPPTTIVETSPRNYQGWYLLARPEPDARLFDAVIAAFIRGRLLDGADPGMAGVNRVGRLPGFVNGKPQHDGFRVRVVDADWSRRYTIDDLVCGFGLHVVTPPERPLLVPSDGHQRIDEFKSLHTFLRNAGMVLRRENVGGWIDIICPWASEHSNPRDNVAGLALPSADNGWTGAFRCHHGHCLGRGWRALAEFANAANAERLEMVNAAEEQADG